MAKYIDADNLIDELSAACMPIHEKGITGILGDNSSIADIINEQPTADVEKVKHGYWHPRNHRGHTMYYVCARCGAPIDCSSVKFAKYCYKCGARMDGDNNA